MAAVSFKPAPRFRNLSRPLCWKMDGRWLVNFPAALSSGQRWVRIFGTSVCVLPWQLSLPNQRGMHAQWVVTTIVATGQNMTPSAEQIRKISVRQTPLCPLLGAYFRLRLLLPAWMPLLEKNEKTTIWFKPILAPKWCSSPLIGMRRRTENLRNLQEVCLVLILFRDLEVAGCLDVLSD